MTMKRANLKKDKKKPEKTIRKKEPEKKTKTGQTIISKTEKELRVLILEDNVADAELMERQLKKDGIDFISRRVDTRNGFLQALIKFKPDLILADYKLPKFDALQALELRKNKVPQTPFIIITGSVSEEVAVECIKLGADDYLLKDRLARLPEAVVHALEIHHLQIEKIRAEETLRDNEIQYRTFIDASTDMAFLKDSHFRHLLANRALCRFYGKAENEIIGKTDFKLMAKSTAAKCRQSDKQALAKNKIIVNEETTGGQTFETRKFPVKLADGRIGVGGYIRDMSERKHAEDAVRESADFLNRIINAVADPLFVKDGKLRFILINNALEAMIGQAKQAIIGKSDPDFFPKEQVDIFWRQDDQVLETGKENINEEQITDAENVVHTIVTKKTLYTDATNKKHIVGVIRDISERKKSEALLQEKEASVRKKLKAILEPDGNIGALELADIIDAQALQLLMDDFYRLTHIGIAIIDLQGKILVATGWQDICTQFHRVHPQTKKYCLESDLTLSLDVVPGTFKLYRCKNHMWDMATPIMVGGNHVGNLFLGQFFFEDEVPNYELFRRQARQYGFSEKKYLAALERVPRWSREKTETVMSFYTKFAGIVSSMSHSSIKLARALAEKEELLNDLRQSKNLLETVVNAIPAPVFYQDAQGVYLGCNSAFADYLGLKRKDIVGKTGFDIAPRNLALQYQEEDMKLLANESAQVYEANVVHADGTPHLAIFHKAVFHTPDGSVAGLVGAILDISERKQAEEQIRASLNEKEVLLKEIHHRVKNNLQVISGLLTLQASQTNDERLQRLLKQSQSRIWTMALIHQTLYQSGNLADIDMADYIRSLSGNLLSSYAQVAMPPTVSFDLIPLRLAIDKAIPLALIINELVTNAIKHAFPHDRPGEISIALREYGDRSRPVTTDTTGMAANLDRVLTEHIDITPREGTALRAPTHELTIADNGAGLPAGFDPKNQKSLGLQLVTMLVKQLDGTLAIGSSKGTAVTITFSYHEKSEKHS